MATATRITKSGNKIVAEVERRVVDEVAYADGWNVPTGRNATEYKIVRIFSAQGKVLTTGYGVVALTDRNRSKAPAGVVGTLGQAWVSVEAAALIAEAMAEAEAAAPKSVEFVAIEQAHAAAAAKAMRIVESESEKLQRRMDDPDSDL